MLEGVLFFFVVLPVSSPLLEEDHLTYMRKMKLKGVIPANKNHPRSYKSGNSAWIRPLKAFYTELWLHYGVAILTLGIYLVGWVSEIITISGAGIGAAAGCFVALLLMRGYKVSEKNDGEKYAVIERWSLVLRSLYLSSRALALGFFRSPWPGVASLGGSVVIAIIIFQIVQGIYLHALLANV